jgi:integrase/recombinase XerD
MKWSNALKDFKHFMKIERGLSENTVQNYCFDVKKLINYLEENEIKDSATKINKYTIQEFLYHISKFKNSRTQSRIISGLRSFFDYLIFENYRKDNPLEQIETPKIGRKLPDTLSIEEIDKIINSIEPKNNLDHRNKTIIEILYSCGLRVSELINLRLSDLFFKEDFIKVTGKGNKQRFVPIGKSTQKIVSTYIDSQRCLNKISPDYSDIIFLNRYGRKLTRAMIFTVVKNTAEKAQIKKNISPHTFRHSFATHLLENGADLRSIQMMMGHQSITTTEIYMHLDKKHLRAVMNQFHPRKIY